MKKVLSSVLALRISVDMIGIFNAGSLPDLGLKGAYGINSSPMNL
jgi:hypothetical protein